MADRINLARPYSAPVRCPLVFDFIIERVFVFSCKAHQRITYSGYLVIQGPAPRPVSLSTIVLQRKEESHDQSLSRVFIGWFRQEQPHLPDMQQAGRLRLRVGPWFVLCLLAVGPGVSRTEILLDVETGAVPDGKPWNLLWM